MNFTLREWQSRDVKSLVKYANNKNVSRYLTNMFPFPYLKKDAQQWIALTETFSRSNQLVYCIDVNGQAVGSVDIRKGDDIYCKTGTLGYWLGEPFWGNQIVPRAVKQICSEAFAVLDLARIQAEVFENNEASKRVLRKCGFYLEGIRKNAVIKDGILQDVYVFALLKEACESK